MIWKITENCKTLSYKCLLPVLCRSPSVYSSYLSCLYHLVVCVVQIEKIFKYWCFQPHNLERGRSQSIAANLLDPSLLGLGAIPDTLCDPHEDEAYLVLPLGGNVNPLSVMIRKHSSEKIVMRTILF